MSSTQLVDFTPANIDMVFAISQENLNQGLAEYIQGLNASVEWAYDFDQQGNLIAPADALNPAISFSGTLAPPIAIDAQQPWIVDLSQQTTTPKQVTFNVTFADGASFNDNQRQLSFTQSAGSGKTGLWKIQFQVTLSLQTIDADASGLPDDVKAQMAALTNNYGEVFDLNQVLLDLETLIAPVNPSSVVPDGINRYDWDMLNQGMNLYLKANHGVIYTTPPSAGFAATHNGAKASTALPSFTPTSFDIVISPVPGNPGSSTLIFVFMMDGTALPQDSAASFENVTLITDPSNMPGVALVAATKVIPFLQAQFPGIGIQSLINQYAQCTTKQGQCSKEPSWELTTGSAQATVSDVQPTSTNTAFLEFCVPTQNSSLEMTGDNTIFLVSTTDSIAKATLGGVTQLGYTEVDVGGTFTMSAGLSGVTNRGTKIPGWTSPNLAWTWSVPYVFQPINAKDAQSGGGIQFVRQDAKAVFPQTGTSDGGGTNWSTNASPDDQTLLTGLFGDVTNSLQASFKKGVATLTSVGNFVFPIGNNTFTFQDPAVNNSFALYSTIQYQNPN